MQELGTVKDYEHKFVLQPNSKPFNNNPYRC